MEIEAKFSLPDDKTAGRLKGTEGLAGFTLSDVRVRHVRDTYLDTAGRLILAAGYACRQREQDGKVLVTLKGLPRTREAIHRREELETLLAVYRPPAEWPASPVRDRVLQLIGEAELVPLFSLQQARAVRLVKQGERAVAELSLDKVNLDIGGQERAYFELEIELAAQGTEDDLATIVACLQNEWGLRPEPRSKFERALALLDASSKSGSEPLSGLILSHPPLRPGLEPDDSMAEAARKTFLFHFRRMLYHEPGTRLGEDIEELHDMRVATRRMRAAVPVFRDYLEKGQMAPFVKGMRRTGRALGAVRDLDVFWEKTRAYLDDLLPTRQDDLELLRVAWTAERQRAREKMLSYLDSDRYARFKEQFGAFLQKPGAGGRPVVAEDGEPLPHRLRHVVPVAVYHRLAAVRAFDEWLTGPDVPLERYHQLRIAAKGLRYTLEYFREILAPEAETMIKEIKGLQDHLGDLQDAVVASELLRDFLAWGTWHARARGEKESLPTDPVVAPGVEMYLATRQAELEHLVKTFPKAWARVRSPEFAQLAAAALAPL